MDDDAIRKMDADEVRKRLTAGKGDISFDSEITEGLTQVAFEIQANPVLHTMIMGMYPDVRAFVN